MIKYKTTTEHLQDEYTLAYLLLYREALKKYYSDTGEKEFHLCHENIAGEEKTKSYQPAEYTIPGIFDMPSKENEAINKVTTVIENLKNDIIKKKEAGIDQSNELRMYKLAELFGLSDDEVKIICICLLSQLNYAYEKIYSYLYDDHAKCRPCPVLIANILYNSFEQRLSSRDFFSPDSPLIKYRVIEFIENISEKNIPDELKQLKVNQGIINYLMGKDLPDNEILPFVEIINSEDSLDMLIMPEELKYKVRGFIEKQLQGAGTDTSGILFLFSGPEGCGKISTAGAVSSALGMPMILIDLQGLYSSSKDFIKALQLVSRDSILLNAALYLNKADFIFEESGVPEHIRRYFIETVNRHSGIVFIDSREQVNLAGEFKDMNYYHLTFSMPAYKQRVQLWKKELGDSIDGNDISALAGAFRLNRRQIRNTVIEARGIAVSRANGGSGININDLNMACRAQSNRNLGKLAVKLTPVYNWQDIILPEDELAQLKEIVNHMKHRHMVFDQWGAGTKHSRGKGLNAVFHGPSGTGKTMAAEIIAKDLELDIYRVDLASVVSKYIGETEKNLSRIFEEAGASNAILFFDEADALFGRRTEVQDAHDRYANIEAGYLLQKMDEYQGAVILATNMMDNIDSAFIRRMHFIVEFPFPDENERFEIWKRVFAEKTPLDAALDYEYLARQFNITGGSIKNISLASSFYAAGDGRVVTMGHILHATRRELQKIGRACTREDFGEYAGLEMPV